ncbi:MAG: hypothetical protein H6Q99_1898 [Proteobacteria bacterium]|nr:hypothetical protein [Pseudomonadota bacterium]
MASISGMGDYSERGGDRSAPAAWRALAVMKSTTVRTLAGRYFRLGYRILELPLSGIEERADFVLKHIAG